jgi:hypothetical protein
VKDRVFKDFSKRAGVDNINEHERRMKEALKQKEDQVNLLRRQLDEQQVEAGRLERAVHDHEQKERVLKEKEEVQSCCFTFWSTLVCAHVAYVCSFLRLRSTRWMR